jgi:flavodoxin
MKIAVRYHSRGGNTKAVAEAIAKALGSQAKTIDTPIDETVDVLFVGGGTYGMNIDAALKTYLENLNPNTVKSVAVFATAAGVNITEKIKGIAKRAGVTVRSETLPVRFWFRNYGGKGTVTLTDKQTQAVNGFVSKVISAN